MVRSGTVNALVSWDGWVVIANPAEVMAHEDETLVEALGSLKLTEASFTKVMQGSHVKLRYVLEGERMMAMMKPLLLYDGAECEVSIKARSDSLFLQETIMLGRRYHGEEFTRGRIRSVTEVRNSKGKLIVYDTMEIKGSEWKDPNFLGGDLVRTTINVKDGEAEVKREIERRA